MTYNICFVGLNFMRNAGVIVSNPKNHFLIVKKKERRKLFANF